MNSVLQILLLEDNVADAELLQELVLETGSAHWQITSAEYLSEALKLIAAHSFDVVLSDLSLPDAFGLDTVIRLHSLAPDLPIVVLTGQQDEIQGLEAIRQGAQDYLVKGQLSYPLLTRTIQYAIERASTQRLMRQQTAAMAACSEGIAILNSDREHTYLNQAYASMYGYDSSAELVGRKWNVLYDETQQFCLEQTMLLQENGFVETIGKRQDGSYFNQELGVTALDDGGFIFTVRDSTDRKQSEAALRRSEAQFRQIFRDAPIGMSIADPHTRQIIEVNPIWCQITGYTASELGNLGIDTITHPEDLPYDLQYLERANRGELETYCLEKRFIRKDGEPRWTNLAVTVLRDLDSQPYCSLAMIEDITERKRAEVETLKALEKERELSQLKSNFVSMVSHEFRTPMTTIRTATELLQNYSHTLTGDKKDWYFDQIYIAISNILHLLDEVLLIGKADAGKLEFNPAPLYLEDFCHELTEHAQLGANYNQTIQFASNGECVCAEMDETLLRHIFTNLLSNAIKYSPGGCTIDFSLFCQNDVATFVVKDAGIGIPEKDQQRLFETFHRASNVGEIQGTGLGLAIVKSCVDLHGGTIQVESEVGVGTTFTVTLPLRSSP